MSQRDYVYSSIAYVYDGTLEGLLTCVFRAYENHEDPCDVAPEAFFQPRIDQYVSVIETDGELALRVARGIKKTAGTDGLNLVKVVGLSCVPDAGTLVYRFIRYAMERGKRWDYDVMHPAVEPMLRIRKSMANEKERLLQFMRFEELRGGLWFATCNPKANLVPFVMDFFSARFNTQSFIIYDEVHHIAGVHESSDINRSPRALENETARKTSARDTLVKDESELDAINDSTLTQEWCQQPEKTRFEPLLGSQRWYLVPTEGTGFPDNLPSRSENEELMRRAWQAFYDSVAVEARYNPKLRTHWMPQRFWKNITEMQTSAARPHP